VTAKLNIPVVKKIFSMCDEFVKATIKIPDREKTVLPIQMLPPIKVPFIYRYDLEIATNIKRFSGETRSPVQFNCHRGRRGIQAMPRVAVETADKARETAVDPG
jgi:hypothetical protein